MGNEKSANELPAGCGYQGYEFGAGLYPDSICVDGRLFDADDCDDNGNLYEPIEDIPCPICKPEDAMHYWTERNMNSGGTRKAASAAARSLVSDIRERRDRSAVVVCG